jgi:dTDP-L-rhamnose 4-epimerase
MARVLITGGAGFIGSHTADALKDKGLKVRLMDNLSADSHGNRWPDYVSRKGYELVKGDVRRKEDWAKALAGVDYVMHFAVHKDFRPDFSNFFLTNTVGTSLLYEVAVEKRIPLKKVVIASSQAVYGDGFYECDHGAHKIFHAELRSWEKLLECHWDIVCSHGKPAKPLRFREDQKVAPVNSYGISKYAAENLSLRLGRTFEIPTTILRYSVVQGPRQSLHNLFSDPLRVFVLQALGDEPITVFEDGEQTRDFVNVKDVVSANVLVLQKPQTNFEVLNVGGERAVKLIDLAKAVKRITGSPSEVVLGNFRRTDIRHAVSDISRLKKYGWRPKRSTEDSIRSYIDWILEAGKISRKGSRK